MDNSIHFTKREWFVVIALGSVNFANTLCVSLQAPFFPHEAESKGATSTEYGFVFGIYELVAFISCPIIGKYVGKVGAKCLLNVGVVTSGTSVMLFGLLTLVNSHYWFISLSFLLRIVEAMGAAALMTSSFVITGAIFPDNLASMFATLETFYGLGHIFGPSIGGYLFELGGFMLPFVVVGGIVLLIGLFVFIAIPTDNTAYKNKPTAEIVSVLKLTPVMWDVYCMMATTTSLGFYAAILEPHLRQFNLSPLEVGGMFVISGGTYTLTAPLVGRLCDIGYNPRRLMIVGSLLIIASFSLVGPAPFMPFHTTFWVVCVGLVFEGLGFGTLLVCSFIDALQSAISHGLPEDIATFGLVSGIITSAFCLGGFIGPSVAGYLLSAVGFQKGSLFVIVLHVILFLYMTWSACTEPSPKHSSGSDKTPQCGRKENCFEEEKLRLISGVKQTDSTEH